MSIEFIPTQAIETKLKAIEEAAQSSDLMDGIGRAIRTQIELGFRATQDPYGQKWAGLKYRSGQPLSNTRRLRGSITQKPKKDSVTFGTNVCYAVVHQFGATIEATPGSSGGGSGICGYQRKGAPVLAFPTPGGWIRAKKVTIPARPFFPDQRGMPKAWSQAIRREVLERFKQL